MKFETMDDLWEDFKDRIGGNPDDYEHPANKVMFTTGAIAAISYIATAGGPEAALERTQELMTAIEKSRQIEMQELDKKDIDCYDGSP